MYELAKSSRDKMKAKARRLANPGDYYKDQEVSSADWSPAPPLKTEMKTGARPIMKPSSKGTGESYAARDTKKAIGEDMKRGAFKAGGAVKGVSIPTPKETLSTKEIVGSNPIRPTRGAAGYYKKGGKVKKADGGDVDASKSPQRTTASQNVYSPKYNEDAVNKAIASSNRSGQRISGKESSAIKALLKGRTGRAGGGSVLEKMVGKPKTGSDMSQVGKMGSARYPTEEKETIKEIISPRDTTKETVETMERLGEAGRKRGGSTYGVSSPLRLTKTVGEGKKTAKIYKNPDSGEYQVKHFIDGAHQKKADYFTDDKEDAHGTASYFTQDRDARKSGGRTRAKGKTNINIVIAAGRKAGPEAPALDMAAGMPSAPANIPVPMPGAGAPPPAAMPMGGPPGMPAPGIPPMPPGRKTGGRITKIASSYKDMQAGSGSGEGRLQKTDIAKKHHDAPARKAGGKVYSSYKDMDAGAGSGPGRLEKTEIERKQRARGK